MSAQPSLVSVVALPSTFGVSVAEAVACMTGSEVRGMAVYRPAENPKEGLAMLMCTAEALHLAETLPDNWLAGSLVDDLLASDDSILETGVE